MLTISPLPAFNDNYIWSIEAMDSTKIYVVDPGDASVVEDHLNLKKAELAGILITHHHHDHTGGITALTKERDIPVYGPDTVSLVTHPLTEGDRLDLAGTLFRVISTPGHTMDHIVYFADQPQPVLFCGDTLFAGGCGRLFEGTPELMHRSLTKLAHLPEATRVYCAHEYTLANLRFCAAVEPENPRLQERMVTDSQRRQQHQPTVPSTLSTELQTNPFLRCHEPAVIAAAERYSGESLNDGVNVLRVIRAWKDNF